MASPRPPTHEKISNGARQGATPTSKMVPMDKKEEPHLMVLSPPTATTTMAPTRSSSPKMKTMESTLQDDGRSTQLYANMTMICPPRPRSSQCFRCTQDGHHLWECPNLHCDVCTSNKHMTWECNTPQAHKLYFAQLDAQFANMTLQDTIVFKEWCKEMDKMTTMKPTLQDGVAKVEHGIFPSTKEANGVENGEHGMIPSPMEAHGDEKIEPTPICLNDEMVPIPCSMEDEFPIMEKMYMVHEDDAITPCLIEDEHGGHMEPTTSTTPTSNESDYKGYMTFKWTFKRWCHLPPLHVHEDLSSRTTLFQVGGDDAARPSVFTASCASSPRRHAKVNLLLYACLESPIWDDILLHTPTYLDDRNSTTSTERREDAMETRGRKADVTEAWKRRRKRSWKLQGRHCRPTQAGTAAWAGTAALPTPALPPMS
ncbi:hypothetical protein QYE76_031671 [Lolium multiflorum]|uniref:CCHC-type domain-containing protein n=1 Tax=Lolium multiflorum TaxID=4521 RepID=A0AAD8VKM9_LOLMU|nr:hypothetical protein QYE76_031671 [Lolium multiflorum]